MNAEKFPKGVLTAYLDGEVSAATRAQIEADVEAMAWVRALESADSQLSQLSHRPRPTQLQIGEAELGLAPAVDLRYEPVAQRQADLLRQFWTDLEAAPVEQPSLLERARVLIAELLTGDGAQPALALGLRGTQEGVYAVGDYQVVVETDEDFDDPTRRVLTGLVMGLEEADATAALWRSDASKKLTAALDEFGNFTFSQLESGQYELIITGQLLTIHVPNLEL